MSKKSASYYGVAGEMSREEYESIKSKLEKDGYPYKAMRLSADRANISVIGVSMNGLSTSEMIYIGDVFKKTAVKFGIDPETRPVAGELIIETDQ